MQPDIALRREDLSFHPSAFSRSCVAKEIRRRIKTVLRRPSIDAVGGPAAPVLPDLCVPRERNAACPSAWSAVRVGTRPVSVRRSLRPFAQKTDGTDEFLQQYAHCPISLADACPIRCAEISAEPRIATFDTDFRVYRWARNRRFDLL